MDTGSNIAEQRVQVLHGDSREILRQFPDNHFDSVVTDPPYALVSITKRFGKPNAAPAKGNAAYTRASAGFMGQQWDTGETAFDPAFWAEVLRVLKPGGHVAAFSGTRTYHRMACAIEDAGFEIRDQIGWAYGSGFPKSHDVSKGIDRHNGDARPVIGKETLTNDIRGGALLDVAHGVDRPAFERDVTSAASAASAAWEGWGTALKPAWEPIVLARKPITGTVASNVLQHGTGALHIAACRVGYASEDDKAAAAAAEQRSRQVAGRSYEGWGMEQQKLTAADYAAGPAGKGRWPANIVHDGSQDVVALFPDSAGQQGDVCGHEPSAKTSEVFGEYGGRAPAMARNDGGSAARFFYTAKADAADRIGSKHPTVKPVDLMQWLVRLITQPGGLVLEPFAGSGTTGEAAFREGMRCVMIEREASFVADIERRISLLLAGPEERSRSAIKTKIADGRIKDDAGPLFGSAL